MDTVARLRELARNLYWTWHPHVVSIFRDLDPQVWRETYHNPVEFLDRLTRAEVEQRAQTLDLDTRINEAFHALSGYVSRRQTPARFHVGPLPRAPVAYFSAEFGLHESLPIYSGGLGILAGDHLKAASDMGVPLIGVGLFYAKGYFYQELDTDGNQIERYFSAEADVLPLDRATDEAGQPLAISVQTREGPTWAHIWTAQVGRNHLLLLDTDVPANSEADRHLTDNLYTADRRVRIRQEQVLGVGGLRALAAMELSPCVIHLNEGHSAFAVLEMARWMAQAEGRNFPEVAERVAERTVFTTHTPVDAGHDRFDPALVETTLGPLREKLGLNETDFLALGRVTPRDPHEPFCMTTLAFNLSRARNGVSSIHGRVSRAMWHALWPQRAEHEVPIGQITNGVHVATWLAPPMESLFDRYLDEQWRDRMPDPRTWDPVHDIPDEELWEQHQLLRRRLVTFVDRCLAAQASTREAYQAGNAPHLDAGILTLGFARRITSYKRPTLMLDEPDRLARLIADQNRPVQIVFAGKAHPADEHGQDLIKQIYALTRDPRFQGRLVFLENHDINVARHLAQGVDLWINNPRRPLEACGTSGQKVVFNGGLNLSVLDGWWAEAYDGHNGFAIGEGIEHKDPAEQDRQERASLFHVLENEVIPAFYQRDEDGLPRGWISRQKHAMQTLAWRFSAQRMVWQYLTDCYLPAATDHTSRRAGGAASV